MAVKTHVDGHRVARRWKRAEREEGGENPDPVEGVMQSQRMKPAPMPFPPVGSQPLFQRGLALAQALFHQLAAGARGEPGRLAVLEDSFDRRERLVKELRIGGVELFA